MKRGPLALLFLLLAACGCGHRHAPATEIGIWYWHSPFNLSRQDQKTLEQIGVSTLYVRAATLTSDGVHVKTMIPQRWLSTARGMPVVLVFNFDAGLDSHFEKLPNATMAPEIASGIRDETAAAEKRGISVAGIQMDIDCPTRLLPKYADLLTSLRPILAADGVLTQGRSFSATALQTWLTSPQGYQKLCDACDFLAPQFYEGQVGGTLDTVAPIADTDRLQRGMRAADSYGKPFYVGVASYGHALLYGKDGVLQAMYHGLGPEDALRHPALRQSAVVQIPKDTGSEELLTLKAVRPDPNGRGLGDTIAYVLPTPETLRQQIDAFRAQDCANCRGLILYRFPAPDDEMALPLSTFADTLNGKRPAMRVEARTSRRSVPWALIGTGSSARSAPAAYRVRLTLKGSSPTLAAHDALEVLLRFEGDGLDGLSPGDFDVCKTGRIEGGQFEICAPAHANAVYLARYHALPGQTILSGDISTPADGARLVRVQWIAHAPPGADDESGSIDLSKTHAHG